MSPARAPSSPADWVLLAGPGLIWGASFLFIAEGLEALAPNGITFLRILIGFMTLALVPAARRPVPREAWKPIVWVGLLWMAFPLSMFPFAEQRISSALTGMLNGANPLFVVIVASLLARQRPSRKVLLGLVVGMSGAVLIALPGLDDGRSSVTGILLVLAALASYGIALNLARPLQQSYGGLPVIFRALGIALALTAPLGLPDLLNAQWTIRAALSMLALGVLGTALAQVMMAKAAGVFGASTASGTTFLIPVVALALGVVVVVMAHVQTFWALAIAVTLTRGLGQSALSVISIAMVGHWFVRKIDLAMAIYSIALSIGFMIAFPVVGTMIQFWGWRTAWLLVGLALGLGLAPLGWLLARRSPEDIGLHPDGDTADLTNQPDQPHRPDSGYTWQQAMGTPTFWLFGSGAALYGLVASGIGLFNESILAERGFGAEVYYQTLIVTALTALVGNFAGGWLATRMSLTRLMAISLFVLAAGLVALPIVTTIGQVMAWATAMGLGGGLVMVLFFSIWPRVYGRRHLGIIQGAAQTMTVLSSAVGPLLLAWCVEWTGSYATMFYLLAVVIAATAAAATTTPLPEPLGAAPGRLTNLLS